MERKLKSEIINTNEAVLFARVSSPKQEDNFSRAAQEKTGVEYAKRTSLEIVRTWSCVESATKGERKNFHEMLNYVKKHKDVQHVIFDITDRMTRNDNDKIKIKDLMVNYGKIVHFARTGKIYSKDSSPDDEFMLDIEVAVAKKMANDIARKTKMGMNEKAEQGWFPACAPVGYLNKEGVIVVDEVKAPLIAEAFELMATGEYSIEMVTDILYPKGLTSRKGKRICLGSMHKVFKNKMYYGPFSWGGKEYQGKHPKIITKELYERANKALSEHNTSIQKSARNHPFNNLIECPLCNHRLVGDDKGGNNMYYRCSSKKANHAGQKIKYLTERELLESAEQIVRDVKITKDVADWMQNCVDRELKKLSKQENKELTRLKKQLAYTENALEDLKENAIPKGYDPELANYQLAKLKGEIADYTMQINNIQATTNPEAVKATSIDILLFLSKLGYIFKEADKHQKAALLRKIGEKYAYDYDPETKEKKLIVFYREPYNYLAEGNKKREAFLASHNTKCSKYSNYQIWGQQDSEVQTEYADEILDTEPRLKVVENYCFDFGFLYA